MATTKTATVPATAGKGRVFAVPSTGGAITTAYRQACLDDCIGDVFTKETIEKMLENGEVVFSDDYYYSENRESLAKYEKVETAPETEVSAQAEDTATGEANAATEASEPQENGKEIGAGDVVIHVKKGYAGEVSEKDGKLSVDYYTANKKGDPIHVFDSLSDKWRQSTPDEFMDFQNAKNTAIEKATSAGITAPVAAIEGSIVETLTKKEAKRLEELESEYEKVDTVERAIPFEKGRILNEIRQGKLFRGTHGTFGDYAFERFGITREYAQNLAQIGGIPELATEALEGGVEVNMTVNAANEMMRDVNKFTKGLGIGKAEFDAIKPVLRNILAVMADVAPKDDQGNIILSERFVASFNETLAHHLTDGVVTIDGKQMTVKAAGAAGLLNASLRSEVLESAAESIRSNAATIVSEFQNTKERQETGIVNGGGKPSLDDDANVKYYRGKKPTLNTECSLHGETEILTVGAGKLQTRCGCRWHVDSESGELVAYEVNELPVKR